MPDLNFHFIIAADCTLALQATKHDGNNDYSCIFFYMSLFSIFVIVFMLVLVTITGDVMLNVTMLLLI